MFPQSEVLKRSANLCVCIIIGRSKVFDLFPRTHKGKNRCDLWQRYALINSRERPQKSDINLEQSSHVETVCLLVRTNSLHIDIDVDVEEMLQEKRGQATYAQIKDYVLEQNGLKISSLYIS